MAELRRFFVDDNLEIGKNVEIKGEEFKHIAQVLRFRAGDCVILLSGDNIEYKARIDGVADKSLSLTVISSKTSDAEPKTQLTLYQALTKGEKMDLIVQKCVELGVFEIVPFLSRYTVAKENQNKLARLCKISDEAVKQCKRARRVNISDLVEFNELTNMLKRHELVIFCNECEITQKIGEILNRHNGARDIGVVVGSEGGFSDSEISELSKATKSCTLGKRILRAETAAIAVCAIIINHFE